MGQNLAWSETGALLQRGAALDVRRWLWEPSGALPIQEADSAHDAMKQLSDKHSLRHLAVGVIGPRDASSAQRATAEAIGEGLGRLGITVICGGKSGVMEAVCKGCDAVGGLSIGILPGHSADDANAFVGIPLPTGLSEGRNMVIAKSARALIAIGGSYGTLSEVAYGLHFSKSVVGLDGAPEVEGLLLRETPAEALEATCAALLARGVPEKGS